MEQPGEGHGHVVGEGDRKIPVFWGPFILFALAFAIQLFDDFGDRSPLTHVWLVRSRLALMTLAVLWVLFAFRKSAKA